ncbi:hypothetical protein FRC08_004892 [Ceratobasidium sp. 394]|nr:hypothetical protein FRC08_004892 [Ceratobasidium sp. 394]KAG9095959.1 hypothetical protein FS749_009414 [Ceratobasidium sp. UAMH 11750]
MRGRGRISGRCRRRTRTLELGWCACVRRRYEPSDSSRRAWNHIRRQVQNLKELDRELVAFSESLPALYKPDGGEKLRELLERR